VGAPTSLDGGIDLSLEGTMAQRVLIVDDDLGNLQLYTDVFESLAYEVLRATDGIEAIEVALRELPDLIVMDLALPGRNGLDAADAIKSDEHTAHIPILMMSGLVHTPLVERARRAGCDGFLAKPCALTTLIDGVEKLLARSRDG
jgi:two-component system cell cycle response regulator DivK